MIVVLRMALALVWSLETYWLAQLTLWSWRAGLYPLCVLTMLFGVWAVSRALAAVRP